MPDDRIHSPEPAPPDWRAAFAALPPEAPDADAWARIARALPRHRRPRWPLWLAAAAVLAMAAVVPWRLSTDAVTQPDAATPVAGAPDASVPEIADAMPDDARRAATPAASSDDDATLPASQPIASTRTDEPEADAPADAASAPQRDETPQAASTDTQPRIAANTGATGPAAPAATDDAASELERLYAESAKLEALVAMARDDRVASTGAAAALASRYDAQVAAIDARLVELGTAQADLADAERLRLWRERVEAMRGLASFETTQRLLAARGERYDAMLVSID